MVVLSIRGRSVAFVALWLGAAACQLSLDFDYDFVAAAGAGGAASIGGGGDGGAAGVSEGNAGDGGSDGATTYAADGGPYAPEAAGSGGGGGAPSMSDAGVASMAGAGGDTGSAGAGGTGGTGGAGGADPSGPPCTGCVELVVPFSESFSIATFQLTVPDDQPALDFTSGVLDWTVRALSLDSRLGLKVVVQNALPPQFPGLYKHESLLVEPEFGAAEWTTLSLDVSRFPATGSEDIGAEPDGSGLFDKTQVRILSLELGVRVELEAPVELHLLIDRVAVSGVPGAGSFEFSSGTEGFELDASGGQVIHHPVTSP